MAKDRTADSRGPEYESFGKNLAYFRKLADLSQAEMAKQLGVPQSTYSGWETGTRKIQLSTIIQLSKFFGKSPDELIGSKRLDNLDAKNDFSLSSLEKDIICKFRTLNNGERAMFLRTIGVEEKEITARMA